MPYRKLVVIMKRMFNRKTNANENVTRYRARLVAKELSQKERINYDELLAAVVKYATSNYFLTLKFLRNYKIIPMKVTNAFSSGNLTKRCRSMSLKVWC